MLSNTYCALKRENILFLKPLDSHLNLRLLFIYDDSSLQMYKTKGNDCMCLQKYLLYYEMRNEWKGVCFSFL